MRLNNGSKCILFNKSLAKFETSYLKESYGINLTGIVEKVSFLLGIIFIDLKSYIQCFIDIHNS